MLILCHHFRNRSSTSEVLAFTVLNSVICVLTLFFLVDEHFFDALKAAADLRTAGAMVVYVWMMLSLKAWMVHCWHYFAGARNSSKDAYQQIEDQVTLEEYEDMTLQFHKRQFRDHARLARRLVQR